MATPAVPRVSASRVLATALPAVALGWVVVAAWLHRDGGAEAASYLSLVLVESAVASVVGWLLVRRMPRHPIGWLLLAHGFLVAVVLTGDTEPSGSRFSAAATQLGQGAWALLYVSLALIGFLFPTGRFLSRGWRWFATGCLVGYVVFILAAGLDTASFEQAYPGTAPPVPGPPQVIDQVVGFAGLAAIAASLVGAVASSWTRLRRSRGEERVQMLWFAWAALSIPGGLALCWLDYWLTGSAGLLTFLGVVTTGSVLPLAIGVAILRTRLFDIELVLSRTLVYAALTALVVATYVGVVALAGALLDRSGAGGLAALAIVAVAVHPVHARLRREVDRWVYGDRSDPAVALRRLSTRLEASVAPAEVLETVRRSVAEALRVDEVRIDLAGERAAAEEHPTGGMVERARLVHRGELLGDLVVVVPPGRSFSAADRQVLDDLARHAAVAIDAVRLTLDLQRSRSALVTAREEERRRLRRDLHDGLGPSLATMVLELNAVGRLVDRPEAQELLRQLGAEARASIAEIRRLVDDLRPPALDEVGLVAALRQRAAALSTGAGTEFVVEGPPDLGALPAAVEVAAYRIALEAMTNVVRHAGGATRCVVGVQVDGAVEVSVVDNGDRPWGPAGRPGVGWASMRERAAELGGSCTVLLRPEGGTAVRAVIPLPPGSEPAPRSQPLPEQASRS